MNSPLVFLFLGSSGVGKTEIAKQLAIYLNHKPWKKKKPQQKKRNHLSFLLGMDSNSDDSESDDSGKDKNSDPLVTIEKSNAFIRLDMSEYQQSHTVHNITGKHYIVCLS